MNWYGVALMLVLTIQNGEVRASPIIPRLKSECFAKEGDINLGLLTQIRSKSFDSLCGDKLNNAWDVRQAEAFIYAIEEVNRRRDVLPNVTLGYVIMDSCARPLTSMARVTNFIPDDAQQETDDETRVSENCLEKRRRFKVTGIVGPTTSGEAVFVSSLMSVFQIPVLGTFSTSDELSDKTRFEYFLRLVPPDRFQAEAMMDLLDRYRWTYISLVYSEGSYGENGAKQVARKAKRRGICIAYSGMIPGGFSIQELDEILHNVKENSKARVVILFLNVADLSFFFSAADRFGLGGQRIWLGSDALQEQFHGAPADGAIAMYLTGRRLPSFERYYQSRTPENSPENPWIREQWELLYDCTWDPELLTNGSRSCFLYKSDTSVQKSMSEYSALYIDGVYTYANALHSMMTKWCPSILSGNGSNIQGCLDGPQFLQYIKDTSIEGISGRIRFNGQGDMLGKYSIRQFSAFRGDFHEIGIWDKDTESLTVFDGALQWHLYAQFIEGNDSSVPVSQCSQPCSPTEYYIQKELPCCWECHQCRSNERLVSNYTACKTCPALSWPDDETKTICEAIPPEFLLWKDALAIILAVFGSLGLLMCGVVSVLFVVNRNARLIKATSRELTTFIVVGMVAALAMTFFYVSKPSHVTCYVTRFGFSLSVTFIYVPLLVKTNRVYRIFSAGKRGTQVPSLVGVRAQLVICLTLIAIQVALSVVSASIAPPIAKQRMPIVTEKRVELFCSLPLEGLTAPLSYNVLLVLLCAVYGFLTRKLPENFNESWFIFVSVSTTSFLWLLFLPTYFTAFYASHQVVLLSGCLIINALVTLLCLFVPKIYALYFVDEDDIKFLTNSITNQVTAVTSTS